MFQNLLKSHNFILKRYYTTRRALLYVPGDDLKKLNKSFSLDVDCIAMDCEDGVAINKKGDARSTIRTILDKGKPQKGRNYDLAVRINSVNTPFMKDDLREVLSGKTLPDTVLLPKVDTTNDLKLFSDEIRTFLEGDNKRINLIFYIESAMAFLNIVELCQFARNLAPKINVCSVVFGSDDFCANIGATRTENSLEILYARQKLVLVAKAFNLQPIDMVYIKFKDLEGLKRQSEEGARMGYTGKQVIHPGQVPIVQEAFMPSKTHIEWALELLKAFEEHQKNGKGAFTFRGNMIDMPTMRQAKNIVDLVNKEVS